MQRKAKHRPTGGVFVFLPIRGGIQETFSSFFEKHLAKVAQILYNVS